MFFNAKAFAPSNKYMVSQDQLHLRIRQAIAWGAVDNESTGYSADEFICLLAEADRRIVTLERELRALQEKANVL